jgi:SAM-dependent methyltransferase
MVQGRGVDYDQGAESYAAHRRIHLGVFEALCRQGQLKPSSTLLEVGCGTGNYASALVEHFRCTAYGLDPAAAMLACGRAHSDQVVWVLGCAEQLSFADDAFDLVFSVDVIHHLVDKAAFYHEAARTLRPGGRVCTVTDSEEVIRRREILSAYFPETVELELARYPRVAQLQVWMSTVGLEGWSVVTIEEPYEVASAEPFRDRAYSSLHLISEAAWRTGLERLERDLAHGPIRGSARYACVWGRKPRT